MKKVITTLLLISVCVFCRINAQPVFSGSPEITTVAPYNLEVGYNTTTVILFPVSLVPTGDRGTREIIMQQEKSVNNVLKIKAAKKDFHPTNLHVYTVDGNVYVFNITYTEYPAYTTYILSRDNNESMFTPLILNNNIINENFWQTVSKRVSQVKHFYSRAVNQYGMKLQLRTIHVIQNSMVFGFRLANFSNLDFDLDFVRMYIRDEQQVKRSSVQEQEIIPVYKEDCKTVAGKEDIHFIIVVPKFTIPDRKECFIELFEKNGGRRLTLKIKNRHLLKSKPL